MSERRPGEGTGEQPSPSQEGRASTPGTTDQPPPIEHHADGVVAIDTLTGGMERVTAGYLIDAPRPTLIECGPALTIDAVLTGLSSLGLDPGDLAYLVLTHIHLDHAGGAGDVAAAFPDATVVVSDVGAPHLHDPKRLNASSRRVYGPLFDRVYGACTPIDAERLLGVSDGHVLDLGAGRRLELLYTPGHAKHHIGVFDPSIGAIFSGDSVGVKLPGMRRVRPATPPPDFHLEASLTSIDAYRQRAPERLYLAHYGPVDPPLDVLDDAAEQLRLWTEVAGTARGEARQRGSDAQHELDHVAETLQHRFAVQLEDDRGGDASLDRQRIELLSDTRANAAGILRYLDRLDDGSLTPVG